jgi:hypothetical protein
MEMRKPVWGLCLAVIACVLCAQAMLIFNPGYYSHDELQWAHWAALQQGRFLDNGLWTNTHVFQYRPLTFSLWIWLSWRLFDHPYLFHAVIVVWGSLNAAMLASALRWQGLGARLSFCAALTFALGPYAAYTHGWVGTIADLIWVGSGLLIALLVQRKPSLPVICIGTFLLTATALLAKESALVIPALLLLAWWYSGRAHVWAAATVASAVPAGLYIAWRFEDILFAKAEAGSVYHWSATFIPWRWLEYQLFPMMTNRFAVGHLDGRAFGNTRVQLALLLWLMLIWALWRAGKRWPLAFLLAGTAALGPVLILAEFANQYAYGFAAVTAAICAMAWPHQRRAAHLAMALAAVLCVWHGLGTARSMRAFGVAQAVFSPALADAVAKAHGGRVRLRLQPHADRWLYLRLTSGIPSYAGVPIGDRVELVKDGGEADYEVQADGVLLPLRKP